MFTLTEERRVEWPVKVHVAEGGAARKETFTGVFSVPDIDTAQEAIGDGTDWAAVRTFLSEVLVDWKGVVDAEGNEVPCNAKTKATALSRHDVVEAVGIAFREVLRGGRRKN